MDTAHSAIPHRSKLPIVLAGVLLVAILLCIAALVAVSRLHGSEPIEWGNSTGPGSTSLKVNVFDPPPGSDGKRVFYVSQEEPGYFVANFDIVNTGRWPIRVDGLQGTRFGPGGRWPIHLTEKSSPPDEPVKRLGSFWLQPGEQRFLGMQVVIPKQGTCGAGDMNGQVRAWDHIDLRLHYLRVIDDTQRVPLPFAIGLVCGAMPPAYDGF